MSEPSPYLTGDVRYLNKSVSYNERENYHHWFDEQIKMFGQAVDYFTLNYQLSAHDAVYGEQPNATFSASKEVIMMVDLSETSIVLGNFGLQADDELTAFITISSYKVAFGSTSEPKAGDVFQLSEYGDERHGERGAKTFEITERRDQDVAQINPLIGHYVWQLKARRVDYTFQPGLSAEVGSNQVTDGDSTGLKSGYNQDASPAKVDSTNDVDTEGQNVFDYSNIDDGDDVYGDYF